MSDEIGYTFSFNGKGIVYDFADLDLQVAARPKGKGTWIVEVLRDGSTLGVDSIDPTSSGARKRLTKSLVNVSDDDREKIGKTLLGLVDRISHDYDSGKLQEQWRSEAEQVAQDQARCQQVIAELEPEVMPLAMDPTLLYRAGQTARDLGIAGEQANVPLLYLALTSRCLENPISVSVKGESSGGKNNLVGKVVALFPSDALIELTGMSERALVYDDTPFAHKTVIVYEVHGNEAADYVIRSLQSEGKLRWKTVIDMKPVTIDKEGPTNFITTTTQPEIHAENETRQWSIFVDESEETTREAKRIAAREAAGLLDDPDCESWQKLQRWLALRPAAVVIPYAEYLAETTPDHPLRIRRDFRRLLVVIETVTFLHQAQRKVDKRGRLVSTIADYAMARPLVANLALVAEMGMGEKTRRLVDTVCHIYAKNHEEPVTYKDLVEATGFSKSEVSKWINPAIEEAFIENLQEGKGEAYRLVPGLPLRDGAGLPPVADLIRAFPDLATGSFVDPITGEEMLLSPPPGNTGNGGNTPDAKSQIVYENARSNRFQFAETVSKHPEIDSDRFQVFPETGNTLSDRDSDTRAESVSSVSSVSGERGDDDDSASQPSLLGDSVQDFPKDADAEEEAVWPE